MSKIISKGYISDKINGIKVNSSLKCNADNFNNKVNREIKFIVMHYTGNKKDTAKNNANYFTGADRQASAHFFVDNSNIYQSVELRDVAWHCGTKGMYYHKSCRNSDSIGIEMCCTAGNYKISTKTIKNSAHLCAYLCKMIGVKASEVDTYVLRHYDVTHKTCPAQMVNNTKKWKEFKDLVKKILKGEDKEKTNNKTAFKAYEVKVISSALNIRKTPKWGDSDIVGVIKNKGTYTIVAEKMLGNTKFGKLKSGKGWISLGSTYVKKL
jgi:N-acetylmuramoyl-L-alanine amidase CwlA